MIRLTSLLAMMALLGVGKPGFVAADGDGESACCRLDSGIDGFPKAAESTSFAAQSRPPAPEVWRFTVQYRGRKGPQFQWGPWRDYSTITGSYNEKRPLADHVADAIQAISKNYQSRVLEKRIR
jgi:hypothetical protein